MQNPTLSAKETANRENTVGTKKPKKSKKTKKGKNKQNTGTEMTETDDADDNCILPVKGEHIAVNVEEGFGIGEVKEIIDNETVQVSFMTRKTINNTASNSEHEAKFGDQSRYRGCQAPY